MENNWISVETKPKLKTYFDSDGNKLTEVCITVIVYDELEEQVYAANYSEKSGFDMGNPDVKLWQPLPQPPKK